METALLYARQIAEALEAAHEKGIVHRDLMPANIKVTPEGVVKVLDFGLAAVASGPAMDSDPTKSPTMTLAATQAGTVLGTAAYMSPEQAAGKPADKRADIWSFGVVLFELLIGKRLFEGETVSHTLAGVLAGRSISTGCRVGPRPLSGRCCAAAWSVTRRTGCGTSARRGSLSRRRSPVRQPKPRRRCPNLEVPSPGSPPRRYSHSYSGRWHGYISARPRPSVSASSFRSPRQRANWVVSIYPRMVGSSPSSHRRGRPRSKSGSDRSTGSMRGCWTDLQGLRNFTLFWSWDGEQLAYQSGDKLYKIARIGGPPVVLADAPERIQRGIWPDGGIILFGTASGLFRVSSSGGAPVKLDDQAAESPAWLPNGRFLYVRTGGVFAGSLSGGKPVAILPERAAATYVLPLKAVLPGQLLFIRGETLLAQLALARL